MEKIKYPLAVGIGLGSLYLGITAITNEIEHQGDRLEQKMVDELDSKTITLTDALSESTDGATSDLKEYIGNITIEDLMDEN